MCFLLNVGTWECRLHKDIILFDSSNEARARTNTHLVATTNAKDCLGQRCRDKRTFFPDRLPRSANLVALSNGYCISQAFFHGTYKQTISHFNLIYKYLSDNVLLKRIVKQVVSLVSANLLILENEKRNRNTRALDPQHV